MKPKHIVYFIAVIMLCFVFRGFQIHKEIYQVLAEGYEVNQPICEIKEKIENKMGILKSLLTQLTALVFVLTICVSFRKQCH
jgi:hypothetical protein|tara:strand:+ start:616 stop:861 length:246 start_codon:yes stop_codon:yes gene_type:complete